MNLSPLLPSTPQFPLWLDGDDEQEDELDDVHKGILDAPTDDEGPGSIDEKNDKGRSLESEDEDDEEARGVASQDDEDELHRDLARFPKA